MTVKLVDVFQGKWLGHPLHPAIVHVPVGAWTAACILDFVSRFASAHAVLPRLAFYFVAAGLVVTLGAVPTGLAEWAGIKKEKPAWKVALYHMVLNALAAIVWGVNLALRVTARDVNEPATNLILATSLVGTGLLLAGAYLGSLLAFDHGVSVARQSKEKWRAIAERGGARLPKSE